MVECIMCLTEYFGKNRAFVHGRIVLARKEFQLLYLEGFYYILKFQHAFPAFFRVFGALGQVACKHDKIRHGSMALTSLMAFFRVPA